MANIRVGGSSQNWLDSQHKTPKATKLIAISGTFDSPE